MFVFLVHLNRVQIANDILQNRRNQKRFLFLWQRIWIYLIKITQKVPRLACKVTETLVVKTWTTHATSYLNPQRLNLKVLPVHFHLLSLLASYPIFRFYSIYFTCGAFQHLLWLLLPCLRMFRWLIFISFSSSISNRLSLCLRVWVLFSLSLIVTKPVHSVSLGSAHYCLPHLKEIKRK